MTLGSLFDGIGGFLFAAALSDITPVWAAEIEPFCVAVVRERFPSVEHYGDVSKINGAEITPVDIITFGSPCQDLSVAGKRAGMKNESHGDDETTRSGLFYEAIRIITEMREATNGEYPKYICWENVPGAFSSHKGEDFRCVLESICQIADKTVSVPRSAKWTNAGNIVGDGYSVAWRVLDARFWGVAQRRRRIYLIADFGTCAGAEKILFESESVSGYLATCFKSWKRVARSFEDRVDTTGEYAAGFMGGQGAKAGSIGFAEETSPTLKSSASGTNTVPVVLENKAFRKTAHPQNSEQPQGWECTETADTLNVFDNSEGRTPILVYGICSNASNSMKSPNPNSGVYEAETARTLDRNGGDPSCNQGGIAVACMATQQGGAEIGENLCPTITASAGMSGNNQPVVCYGIGRDAFNQGANAKYRPAVEEEPQPTLGDKGFGAVAALDCRNMCLNDEISGTLQAKPNGGQSINCVNPILLYSYAVRRLTPKECERLQGYPDFWTTLAPKDDFTDSEYEFFLGVYEEHQSIFGKKKKAPLNKTRLLRWYNRLASDSNRYKALGNSLAIPCALRVIWAVGEYQRMLDRGEVAQVTERKSEQVSMFE